MSYSRSALLVGNALILATLVIASDSRGKSPADRPAGRVLWSADHEEGTMADWTDAGSKSPGGGIFNTGGRDVSATASRDVAHSGRWSAKTVISGARRAKHGRRAVRLMRWTDKAWDRGGRFFPKEAYYSTWIYFDHVYDPKKHKPWDPGDGGWWNVFQFKSGDRKDVSQPVWGLNVACDQKKKYMFFYLYSPCNKPSSYGQAKPLRIPARKWVHVVALYRSATGKKGRIRVWQDGRDIFDVRGVVTSLGGKSGSDVHPTWGLGNYTNHISGSPAGEGTATVYFDDAAVSTLKPGNIE